MHAAINIAVSTLVGCVAGAILSFVSDPGWPRWVGFGALIGLVSGVAVSVPCDEVVAALPRGELAEIPGAPHAVNYAAADAVAALVAAFAARAPEPTTLA